MKTKKLVSTAMILAFCCFSVYAQETSLDLRKDGRVLTTHRKNHLMRKLKLRQIVLSDALHNKLAGTTVNAIVVPPGKTGDKYLIGVLIGSSTLPDDWTVTEKDFEIIREYSRSARLAQVEQKYNDMRPAIAAGNSTEVAKQTTELNAIIAGDNEESAVAQSYAGYLLQEFETTGKPSAFSEITSKYRQQESRSVHSLIASLDKKHLGFAAFAFDESSRLIRMEDLNSFTVQRQAATAQTPAYLQAWNGRTLIIVTERPDEPFSVGAYKGGLKEYLIQHGVRDASHMAHQPMNTPRNQF